MNKRLITILFLLGLVGQIVASVLLFVSLIGTTYKTTDTGGTTASSIGNPALFAFAIGLIILASIPYLIAWIGALVRSAQLSRWGWFVCLFIFHWIALLVYLFAFHDTPTPALQQPQQYGD